MANKAISDKVELLLRNIHPSWLDEGVPTSQAFRPTPKDGKKLSVDRESKTSPEASYKLHTEHKGLLSAAIYGVTVGEFNDNNVVCFDDVLRDNRAHAYADFSGVGSDKKIKDASKDIKSKAIERGILYAPPTSNEQA